MTEIIEKGTAKRMQRRCWSIFLSLVISLSLVTPVLAVDCQAIKKGIQAEKNLAKRRVLVADAILQCPDDPVLNYKYGLSLERFRKYDKALEYYQKAVLLDPKMGKAYAGMGDIYIYLGLVDESIKAYQQAVELIPADDRFAGKLARLQIKKKALEGEVLTSGEFIRVMDNRGKISANTPLLLSGPALQYRIAFVVNSDVLLAKGISQIAAVGKAMQNDAIKHVRFEISTHVDTSDSSLDAMEESKKRAEMIKEQLVTNFQIDPKRLEIRWHGDSQAIETDKFGEDWPLNQRVEFRRINE
ncbi:MAG: tetratricopeptide repeat protein [Proteobacteria bacterium]|nr:tetratricopeptide repeat protein [Pseudomonadota bacterium]MBU1059598.1 tetratricopeptide repeat protein [Pseudomonadota bacterium]